VITVSTSTRIRSLSTWHTGAGSVTSEVGSTAGRARPVELHRPDERPPE
jgi:hypothetical protein